MNIEEKAKAYDEALEKAKVHINSKGIGDTVDLCRHLFPELRESEDERIRKWLVALVENLGEPADEDAEKELEEMRPLALAYLEKQKENPKSADSIPSNCTSNAKYEDIWHKVSDSLPDNTREVLCKDAIGNYFIGRYYSKGIWEISMYDDCDKSNEDNPPVVMWIDIPSEKQKEQKELPLMDGNADLYFDEWNQQKQNPTKRQCFEEGIRYAQRLQKEQKPVVTHGETYHVDTLGTQQVIAGKMPQKPAEWSEEDEKMCQNVLECLRNGWRKLPTDVLKYESWLRSFCPQL